MPLIVMMMLLLTACTPAVGSQPVAAHAGGSSAGETVRPASQLVFEPDHVNAGEAREGDSATVFLRVRNAGDQMASIVDVTTSCGCTVAEPEERLLMPGGFTRIRLTIDTFAKQDDVQKWVELTDDQGRRSRAWVTLNVTANPHLDATKRSIFDGQCGSCHFAPAAGKSDGQAIYQAVCLMCHGAGGEGAYAPKLAGLRDVGALAALIAAGTGSRHMPGFARAQGGPLTADQIDALSRWLATLDE
ncbi:DUF1573 domain-containing protein [Mariprofundus erugo]|uniref:DUF1573 domain-containing protein n=1 Tax=Mariprofundus erugo TaxID=2528639 RepID=UPI0010FE4A48|nr:DUF1573 domain-containing protein [Mariprofundus erugo]TLS76368.1 DUF1573 domain-containing protein [Mariprofundus erugo]